MNDSPLARVRVMELPDAESVAELAGQLGYQRTPEQIHRWLRDIAARTEQAAFVAELNGEVVGWIEVSLERRLQSDLCGYIGGLVVRDGLRGAGIGTMLCAQAEQWSRQHGAARIRVTSRSTREAAHRFYLRHGYHQAKLSHVFDKALDG